MVADRDRDLKIDVDNIEIGKQVGSGTAAGSGRIKIDNQNTGASPTTVFDTANTPSESTLTTVGLLAASANADIFVRDGSVGVAIDEPNETSPEIS